MAVKVNADDFENEVLKANVPVLVDFYSDSCIPCKQLSPILGDLEDEFSDKFKVVKVNVAFNADFAKEQNVLAVPTLKFYKDGKELEVIRGLVKKNVLQEKIENIIK